MTTPNAQSLDGLVEEWRSIPGFSRYEVSNQGGVRKVCGTPMKQRQNAYGYLEVKMIDDTGASKNGRVNRLVLLAFIGPCPDGHCSAHIDGSRANNRLENLMWATFSENSRHMIAHGRSCKGEKHWSSVLTEQNVRDIRSSFEPRSKTTGRYALARKYKVSHDTIADIIDNKTWRHLPLYEGPRANSKRETSNV